jgi:lysozyme family protein
MARNNFKNCLPVILKHEGGWADHPRDPGGATMKGITLATFRRYKPGASKQELRAISDEDVARIYRDGYWSPVRGEDLQAGVDLAVFDFGVNSGPNRAAKHLQAVAGVKQDGAVGAVTLTALSGKRGDDVVKKLCARRLSFVRGLRTFDVFGKGWSRRIAEIEALGVSMHLRSVGTKAGAKMALIDEADRATSKSKTEAKAGAGTAASGGGVGIAGGVEGFDAWQIAVVVAATVVGAGWFAYRSRYNAERGEAYAKVARDASAAQ